MKRVVSKAADRPKGAELTGREVVGRVEVRALESVGPNPWNPNRMSAFVRASLKAGLEGDGWLSSQALLIWGSDENGETKDLIIDGEHRWRVARELGFTTGPMVVLHNLRESRAKGLTIKMNQKRGSFEDDGLAALIGELMAGEDREAFGLDVGFTEDEIARLIAEPAEAMPESEAPVTRAMPETSHGGTPSTFVSEGGEGSLPPPAPEYQQMKMVQLLYDDERFARFNRVVVELGKAYSKRTVSDTVMEALRHV